MYYSDSICKCQYLHYVINWFDRLIFTLYTMIMSLEDRLNNQPDNFTQDAEPNSEARSCPSNVNDVETSLHILAGMIVEFQLRHKDSCRHSSSDEEPSNTPR